MTSQKTKLGIVLIVMFVGIAIFALNINESSCGIQHVLLTNELQKYEQSLDPEMCEKLIDTINLFNDQCIPEIEILDCG